MVKVVSVEIWSDIICPFCYIGKKRLDRAAKAEGVELDVKWRSFELDPGAPKHASKSLVDMIADKYGMSHAQAVQSQIEIAQAAAAEGIDFEWRKARPGNTMDAHRVAHLAEERGSGGVAHERFMHAYFTEGEPIGERDTIVRIAGTIGLDEAEVRAMLETDRYVDAVRADELVAHRDLNVRGVPFFVFERSHAVSGAQPMSVFREALKQSQTRKPVIVSQPSEDDEIGGACSGGSCEIER